MELGVEEVIAREAHAFYELWDALPLKARQLLVALAKEGTPRVEIYSRAFLEKHNLGPPRACSGRWNACSRTRSWSA